MICFECSSNLDSCVHKPDCQSKILVNSWVYIMNNLEHLPVNMIDKLYYAVEQEHKDRFTKK